VTIAAFILAGGQGKRVAGPIAKIELPIAGLPCIQHLLNTVESIKSLVPFIIASPEFAQKHTHHAIQKIPHGTGDAVRVGCQAWGSTPPDVVLILYADVPLISKESLESLLERHVQDNNDISLLSFNAPLPNNYGRIIAREDDHSVQAIIDGADEKRALSGCILAYSGIMAINGPLLWKSIKKLSQNNQQGELYLTDIVQIAHKEHHKVQHCMIPQEEAQGLNTWQDWMNLENIFQSRMRSKWFEQGTLISELVHLHHDTQLESGIRIEPFVTLGAQVSIQKGAHILPHSHISNSTIGPNALIGPFAHIHSNSHIHSHSHIGNFVECKETQAMEYVKAKHLAYLGNATLHKHTNVGAGAVCANYDGKAKHQTIVEEGGFVGANTTLIAPITVEKNAFIAAGSTVTKNIPENALAIARPPQENKQGWASACKKKS